MSYHKDPEVNDAFIKLLEALCEYERDSGVGSTLLFIPHDRLGGHLVMAQDGKPIPTESITPRALFASAMRYYQDGELASRSIDEALNKAARRLEFTHLEVDQLAVLEEEFTNTGRPYPAYLMRKALDLVKPIWREEHPEYKHREK